MLVRLAWASAGRTPPPNVASCRLGGLVFNLMNWRQFKFPGLFREPPRWLHELSAQLVRGSPRDTSEFKTFPVLPWSLVATLLTLTVLVRCHRN